MTGTFDATFDYTFGGLVITNFPTEAPPCGNRRRGMYLAWKSKHGDGFWLFSGKSNRDKEVNSLGSYERGGVARSTQKVSRQTATLRTEGLTEEEADYVSGVMDAIAVWILAPDADNVFHAIEIDVPTGSFPTGDDGSSRAYLSLQVRFAAVKSQRG